jgi:hypothetical protein
MVTYNYTVSSNSGYKTVQQAIDSIVSELEQSPDITEDIIIQVASGNYPGFVFPRGTTLDLLGTDFRIIIKSSGNFFPVFDGRLNPEEQYVGADIDSANPNITIEGLRFQNFAVGIRATNGSHKVKIKNCIVNDNTNVNILIEQCNSSSIIQNVITNGDFGVVARLCKNVALFHNSIFLNGSVGNADAAIWVQLANDYGSGLSDTGKAYIIGNVIWNTIGPAAILFQEDIELKAIVSNFNDLVKTAETLIAVEKKAYVPTAPRERKNIASLSEWKDLRVTSNPDGSIMDAKSISQDPKFLQVARSKTKKNGLYLDLSLLPISPVLGIVPSFHSELAQAITWLPSYLESSEFRKDIIGNNRSSGTTAAGANDKKSNSGFFGQDVFVSPRDLSLTKNCDIDPLRDLIYKRLDIWLPKIRKGFFSSHEREYYLYAKKACRTIGECAITKFRLPGSVITTKPIKVSVAGNNIEDPRYIDIAGNQLILYHYDLDIQDGTEEIEIQCYIRKWEANVNGFLYSPVYYRLKISQGETRFYLPPDYVSDGPVVITDDRCSTNDKDLLCNREFKLVWDEEIQRMEIVFSNHTNQLLNAQFDRFAGADAYRPLNWNSSNTYLYSGQDYSIEPFMGDYLCVLKPDAYIEQLLPIDSNAYALSWHAKAGAITGITGYQITGNYNVSPNNNSTYICKFYDASYQWLGLDISGVYTAESDWKRFFITIGSGSNADKAPEVACNITGLSFNNFIPENSAFFNFRIENNVDYDLYLDALQYEKNDKPTIYHRKFRYNELTVEYETSEEDEFIDTRLAISPVRNSFSQGFIHIPEIPAAIYDGPINPTVTTLNEVRWPLGRKLILPWARLSGKDKLRCKAIFNLIPENHSDVIKPYHITYYPFDINLNPERIICRQGEDNGVGFSIQVSNVEGNPYAGGRFAVGITEPLARFPGWLHKRYLGANEQLAPTIEGKLDSGGSASIIWIPPDETVIQYVGQTPTKRAATYDQLTSVELNYRADPLFHGNVIILDGNYNKIKTTATEPVKTNYSPTYSQNFSVINLNYPPSPGSVLVSVGGKNLTETYLANPDSSQFFVDYQASKILLNGRVSEALVEYLPSYVFINIANPYRLQFYHDKLFGSYVGPITIGYDALIDLNIAVLKPNGTEVLTKTYTITAQNHLVSNFRQFNTLALEY